MFFSIALSHVSPADQYKYLIFFRCSFTPFKKEYSVFPPTYIKPTFRKDEQETLLNDSEAKNIAHQPVKPALASDTCSGFYDPRVL